MSNLKEIALAAKANNKNADAAKPKFTTEDIARRNEHQLNLLNTFADHLVELAKSAATVAADRGHGWTKVAEFNLPGYDKVDDNGSIVAVPRNAPERTHWAGPGVDPSKGGAPIVMLLQGVRERDKQGNTRLRPDLLAGGKTALEISNEKLKESMRLEYAFNSRHKSLIVSAIWIEEDWAKFQRKRAEARPRRAAPRQERD